MAHILTDFFVGHGIMVPIFGLHNESANSVCNFIILNAKQYIWSNKFKEPHTPLSVNAFLNILKLRVIDCKNVDEILKNDAKIEEWNNVLL